MMPVQNGPATDRPQPLQPPRPSVPGTPNTNPAPRPGLTPGSMPMDIRPSAPTGATLGSVPPTPQIAPPPPPVGGATQPAPGATTNPGANYATLQQTTPGSSLLGQTILPGQGTDRVGLAQQEFNTFAQQTDPQYQASLRDANRYAAAGGALGSGMLNTSLGDLANQRNLQLQGAQQNFMQNALSGSIEDQYRNLAQLNEQQQFQRALQNDAFGQGQAEAGMGYEGNPSSTSLMLSNIYGNNAGQAMQGVGNLIQGVTANNAMQNNPLWSVLAGQMGGGSQTPAPSSGGDSFGIPQNLDWGKLLNQYGGFGG